MQRRQVYGSPERSALVLCRGEDSTPAALRIGQSVRRSAQRLVIKPLLQSEPTVLQLVKKVPAFYEPKFSNTMVTTASNWSLF